MSTEAGPVVVQPEVVEGPAVRVSAARLRFAVLSLAVGGFAIGTTEFVTMGVLPEIARGVDVSVATAGHLISAYALGVVVGVPVLSFFVAGLPRKGLLLALMAMYAVFNLLSAVSVSYGMLLVARFLDGMPHGAYFGVASIVATRMADPRHKGRAVAQVMIGISVANVVGVPFATWLGETLGWRAPYAVAAGLALLTVLLVWASVPRFPADPAATGRGEARLFFGSLQVWLTMAAGAVGFGGMFAAYSYIAPIVTGPAGLPEARVPLFVFAFGVGMVVGTWIAGELARWSVFGSLLIGGGGGSLVMVVFWLVAPHGWWLLPVCFLVTALASVFVINLQVRLMDVAGDAVTLGAAMNHAALNIANAVGAALGGIALARWGAGATPLVGVGLSLGGVVFLLWSRVVHRRTG